MCNTSDKYWQSENKLNNFQYFKLLLWLNAMNPGSFSLHKIHTYISIPHADFHQKNVILLPHWSQNCVIYDSESHSGEDILTKWPQRRALQPQTEDVFTTGGLVTISFMQGTPDCWMEFNIIMVHVPAKMNVRVLRSLKADLIRCILSECGKAYYRAYGSWWGVKNM